MAEVDSIDAGGIPTDDTSSAASEESYDFDFLNDEAPDTADSEVAPDRSDGHSDETPTESTTEPDVPASFDLLRTPLDSLPSNLRPMAEQAREQQRSLQAEFTRTSQSLSELQSQHAQERQQYLDALQRVQNPVQQDDPYAAITANLGEEERGAVDTVRRIAELQYQPMQQQLAEMQQQYSVLLDHVSQQRQQAQASASNVIATELAEARTQFPEADFSGFSKAIGALRETVNPTTGNAFTIAEAYARVSGQAAQESAQLQAQATQARTQAQTRTQTPALEGGMTNGSSEISKNEALKAFPSFFE